MNTSVVPRPVRRRRAALLVGIVAVALAAVIAIPALSSARGAMIPPPPSTVGIASAGFEDGRIAEDARPTVFEDASPAIANLQPALRDALRSAARDAERDGVEILVNGGWRSPEYQQWLLDNAVGEYGSVEEAARWVATPTTSAHVTGDAVDLGPDTALDWLAQHGSHYGLCQIYANERWHYELRSDAVSTGCPQMYADPTEDPRMSS